LIHFLAEPKCSPRGQRYALSSALRASRTRGFSPDLFTPETKKPRFAGPFV
jgi:hypothetical protein